VTAFDYFFPDNTVLINFAIIEQMPLLRGLLLEKGTWVAAVAAECEQSARTGLYPLALGTAGAIMTETLVPTRTEMADARTIRNDIASANEPFPKSYGEAQTLAIITSSERAQVWVSVILEMALWPGDKSRGRDPILVSSDREIPNCLRQIDHNRLADSMEQSSGRFACGRFGRVVADVAHGFEGVQAIAQRANAEFQIIEELRKSSGACQ
jgi:hypothetical protein